MPEQRVSAGYPATLLDDHLAALGGDRDRLRAAVLHSRSVEARLLFAHAATGGAATPDDLIAAARADALPATADPWYVGELARVIALQDVRPEDTADALALLDAALARFGPDRIDGEHQGFHAQLAFHLGLADRAAELTGRYRRMPGVLRSNLLLDLANPFRAGRPGRAGPDQTAWFDRFRALLPPADLHLCDGAGPVIDQLHARPARRVNGGCRITTIVTTFRPGEALLTAVRSLAAQTWDDHEILVVDDGSPAEHDDVLRRCAALDPRVRLLRLPVNGGTYVARNAALDAATGDLVTFQDSDDWSHPSRLEHQARPLLADPALFGTTTVGMRVYEDLVVTRLGLPDHRSYNLSSVMFRRTAALSRLGYLDVVRKGADAEYVERARAVFGRGSVRHLGGPPYALIRLSPHSLSGAEIRVGWMHPARHAYLSAFQAWHRSVAAGESDARRPSRPQDRVFAAPRKLRGPAAGPPPRYDVVLAGDWATAGADTVGQIRALTGRGLRVALLHLEVLRRFTGKPANVDGAVQELVNDAVVDQLVVSDEAEAGLVLVSTPAALLFPPALASGIRADRVVLQACAAPGPAYLPGICGEAARRLFGVEPLWSPSGPAVRALLARHPDRPALTTDDLPPTLDVRQWETDRRGPRSDRPVLGRLIHAERLRETAERRTLFGSLPSSVAVDVRLLDPASAADPRTLSRNWLVFGGGDVSIREFLGQLDFYVILPAAEDDVAVLQAMAAGCVVVAPPDWAELLGDAAVYCEPADVQDTVQRFHAAPVRFAQQSRRARQHVGRRHTHATYARQIAVLAGRSS